MWSLPGLRVILELVGVTWAEPGATSSWGGGGGGVTAHMTLLITEKLALFPRHWNYSETSLVPQALELQ